MGYFVGTIILLACLNLNFVVSQSPDYCRIGGSAWPRYNGSCYLFASKSGLRMSYYDAEDYCRSHGAHLVSVHSDSENEFLLKTMQEGRHGGRAWIGLNILDGENSPKWSDGSNVSYQKLVEKEYPKKEKCFMMLVHKRGWRPEHCALHYYPICKMEDGAKPTAIPPPTTLPPRTGYCPKGWIQFGQKCYKYFGADEKDRLKYGDARQACWNLGPEYNLVSIHSREEQAFLTQNLHDLGTSAWIGISYVSSDEIGHDMVFGWVDNSRNDFSYWAVGHPPEGTWKYCGTLPYDGMNKEEWFADYCEIDKKGYICQRSSDPNFPKPTPEPSKCKPGFQEFRNACYRYMPVPQTQEKAEETCENLGGHLVSVVDGFEQAFLYSLVANESKPIGVGLQTIQGTRYLRWTDNQLLYYSNWAEGEPRYYSSHNKSCVFMDHNNDLKWNVTSCSSQMSYVCKISSDVPPAVPVTLGTCRDSDPQVIDIGDKYCYYVPALSNRVLSWDATSRYCLSKGMQMISLHSDHERDSLVSYLWKKSYPGHLGLIRLFDDKNSFMWVDGSPLNYTSWANREPSTSSDKNCVAFSTMDGKWSLINCSSGGLPLCRAEKTKLAVSEKKCEWTSTHPSEFLLSLMTQANKHATQLSMTDGASSSIFFILWIPSHIKEIGGS